MGRVVHLVAAAALIAMAAACLIGLTAPTSAGAAAPIAPACQSILCMFAIS